MNVGKSLAFYLYPLGIVLLFYLAVANFMSLREEIASNASASLSFFKIQSPFLLGLLLSALNPLQVPFWLGWNRFLITKNILNTQKGVSSLYLLGIGLGTMSSLLIFIFSGAYILKNYQDYSYVVTLILGLIYLGFAGYLILLFYKKYLKQKGFKYILYKIIYWEYWPVKLVYSPIFPVWLYYALKARSFFFFNAANPSIKNGGMFMEPKKEIYDMIPSEYIPNTILINKKASIESLQDDILTANIEYPMIVKPDIGLKSLGVEKIKNKEELIAYHSKISKDFLVQELIDFPKEIGIFYVRKPHEKTGKITGIVSKEFLSVIGNGQDTIEGLIKKNPRSHFQLAVLKRKYGDKLQTVLSIDEVFVLVPFGSHTKGAKFLDFSHKITDKLTDLINSICLKIPEFYFGRLDILYTSFDALENGKGFKIIEVNGAGSEPTHIYDPKHSIFFAWKEIIRHWKLLYEISKANNRKGVTYLSFKEGRAMLKANRLLEEHLRLI